MEISFFKPTPLYKEFIILDFISKHKTTQRKLSTLLSTSVSTINAYIDGYEAQGYLKRHYSSSKDVTYVLTTKGQERKKYLGIGYLIDSQRLYDQAKENIVYFLESLHQQKFKEILLYGAGEVAEIFVQTLQRHPDIDLNIVAILDDNEEKWEQDLYGTKIIPTKELFDFPHDGILIASYAHAQAMVNHLVDINYNKKKIIQFFL